MNGVRLTLDWIASATGGELLSGPPGTVVGEITTDSRTAGAGDFFVALRGPRFDGHEFVAQVLANGAAGVLVDRANGDRGFATGNGVIVVADTLEGLQALAHATRRAVATTVIAITGSAGKTTTKEVMAELLSARFTVVKNKGNLNNHIGLPLSLMQLRSGPDVAVMELGMNHAGEIRKLVAIAEPDVRVWTNVGDAHLGFFASPAAIADAKAEILEGADSDTILVYNADDPLVRAHAAGFAGRSLTFGTTPGATVSASAVEDLGTDGVRAAVTTPAGKAHLHSPLLGRGNLANVLAATAVAIDMGVPLDDVVERVARLRPADRRGAVRALGAGITLIDDSYNSSPSALARALEVLRSARPPGRKVAVLGEMLELGEHADRLHRESGRAAAAAGVQLLFAVGGPAAAALAAAAKEAGIPAPAVHYFPASEAAAAAVATAVGPGDLVLVKGSRGSRTDIIADRIAAEHA